MPTEVRERLFIIQDKLNGLRTMLMISKLKLEDHKGF